MDLLAHVPRHVVAMKTSANFRDLLAKSQGILYEDQQANGCSKAASAGACLILQFSGDWDLQVVLALNVRVMPSTSTAWRPSIEFEAWSRLQHP